MLRLAKYYYIYRSTDAEVEAMLCPSQRSFYIIKPCPFSVYNINYYLWIIINLILINLLRAVTDHDITVLPAPLGCIIIGCRIPGTFSLHIQALGVNVKSFR